MAWIEQTGRHHWRVRYPIGLGRYGSQSGFTNRTAALAYAHDLETDRRRGTWIDPAAAGCRLADRGELSRVPAQPHPAPLGTNSPRPHSRTRREPLAQRPPALDLVQKVGRRRIVGSTYDLYDVHMSDTDRLWVITNPTNCYDQADFKSVDQALTYHIGLRSILHEQFKVSQTEIRQNT